MDCQLPDDGSGFPPTQWTMIVEAISNDSNKAFEAFEKLCEAYRGPIVRWFERNHTANARESAEDLADDYLMGLQGIRRPEFSSIDFLDLPFLAKCLSRPSRPLDAWVVGRLPPEARAALARLREAEDDTESAREVLCEAFNGLLRDGRVYAPERFVGIEFRAETRLLLTRDPEGKELIRLNRLLIEDAYPLGFLRMLLRKVNVRQCRFRGFLVATMRNFLCDKWKRDAAEKRGGRAVHLRLQDWDDGGQELPDDPQLDLDLIRAIHERALAGLDCPKALEVKVVPWEAGGTYEELAQQLGVKSPATLRQRTRRLRRKYYEGFRKEVERMASRADLPDETRTLLEVLAGNLRSD